MKTKTEKIVFSIGCVGAVSFLALCVFSPYASIALLPVPLLLTYYASVRYKPWLLLPVGACYALAGVLIRGGNLFLITGAMLFAALSPVAFLRKKLSSLAEIAVCAAACLLATCASVGIFALVRHTNMTNAIVRAIAKCDSDPITAWLSERFYRKQTADSLGHLPLVKGDELYASEALTEFAHSVGRELGDDTLWYVSGFGTFAGILTALCGFAFAQAEKRSEVRVQDLRLGYGYLKAAVLPALAFSLIGFYPPMESAARTVFNVFITLPTAFCAVTLLFYCATLFRGKARIAAVVVFWLLMAVAAVFWEWGLVILGFLGIADVAIDVRKLLHWALS